jgi:hypothetical protein
VSIGVGNATRSGVQRLEEGRESSAKETLYGVEVLPPLKLQALQGCSHALTSNPLSAPDLLKNTI